MPPNKDESDPRSFKVPGGVSPPWVKRLQRDGRLSGGKMRREG